MSSDEFKIGVKTQVTDTQAEIQKQIDNITKKLKMDTSLAIDFSKSKSEISKATKEIADLMQAQFNSISKDLKLPELNDKDALKYANSYVTEMQKANALVQKQIASINQQISNGSVNVNTSKVASNYNKLLPTSIPSGLTSGYQQLISLSTQLNSNLEDSDKIKVWNEYNDTLEKVTNQIKEINLDSNNIKVSDNQITSLSSNLNKFLTKNTNISKESKKQVQAWIDTIGNGKNVSKATFDSINNGLKQVTTSERNANSLGKNLADTIKSGANSFLAWTVSSTAIMSIKNAFGEMIDNVKELDKSLVELRKVSNLSESGVENVTDQAYELGEKVAKTGTQVIDAITEFKRAGYDLDVSEDMAEAAMVMTNVSEGITDTSDAAGTLISVLKGFNMTADQTMNIVDKINSVSNQSPINFDDIAEGLERTSGTLAQSGTTIDQTIGLITAGFAQLRNVEKVSTSLVTLSARLRGVDEDGEAIDGLSAQLQNDFGKIGVTIEDSEGNLRNVYEIMQDYSKVLPTLTSKQKQYFAELAAGKRNVSTWNAITQSFSDAEKAVNQSIDSTGSAIQENNTYLDSIEGRTTSLISSFQNLSRTIIDSDLIKGGVSFLTTVTKSLTDLSNVIGGSGVLGIAVAGLISTLGKTEKLRLFKTVADDSSVATNQIQIFGKSLTNIGNSFSAKFSSVKGNLFSKFSKSATEATISTDTLNASINATTGASASATVAEEGQAVANVAVGTTATAASIGVKALALGCNMLAGMLVGVVVGKLVSAVANYKSASEKIEDALQDAKSKYSEVSSELDTLNSKLEENKKNIEEILALDNRTYVDKQELTNLQNTNDLLKDQIELKKQKLELAAKDVNSSTEDWFEDYWNTTSFNKGTGWARIGNIITGGKEGLISNNADYNNAISQLQEYYDIQNSGTALTEEQQSAMEKYQETLVDIGNTLSEQTDGYVAITDEQKNWIKNINELISQSNKFSDYYSWLADQDNSKKNDDFSKSLTKLSAKDYDISFSAGEKSFNSLTSYTQDFTDEQKNAWLTVTQGAESASEAIKMYEDSLKSAADKSYDLLGFSEMADKNADSIKLLVSAQIEMNDNNILSVDSISKLLKTYPELEDKIIKTSKGYKIENSFLEDLINAKINVYEVDLNDSKNAALSLLSSQGVAIGAYNSTTDSITNLINAKINLLKTQALEQKQASEEFKNSYKVKNPLNHAGQFVLNNTTNLFDSQYNNTLKEIDKLQSALTKVSNNQTNLDNIKSLIGGIKNELWTAHDNKQSSTTPTEKVVDGIQIRLERLAETTTRYKNTFDDLCNAVGSNTSKISSAYNNLTSSIRNEISANQTAIKKYKAQLSTINLGRGWQDEIKKGSFGIYTSTYEETIKNYPIYEEYYEKLKKAQNAVVDLNNDLKDLQTTFEKSIVDANLNPIQKQIKAEEDFVSYYKQIIDYNKQIGTDTPASLYNSELTSLNNKFAEVNKEVALYKHYFDMAQSQGSYGGKASNEWLAEWISAKSELINIKTEIDGINDSIRDLSFNTYEDVTKHLENVASNLSSLSGLINDDNIFDSDNKLTNLGLTKIGLLTSEYNNAIKSIKNYESKILTLNKSYKAGEYTQSEYQEKLAELQKELLDSTSDAKSYRDSVVDIMQQMSESQMDNLTDVIDKWKDALSSAKDYNDYLEQLDDKQSGVDAIKAQLAALEGVDGIEAKVKKATLKADLTEKQKDLNDTIQQHAYELTTKSLEDLQTAIQESNQDDWNNLYANMDSILDVMNQALSLTAKSSSDIVNTINEVLQTFGVNKNDVNYSTLTGFSTGGLVKAPAGEDCVIGVKSDEVLFSQANTERFFKGMNYTMPNMISNLDRLMSKAKTTNRISMPVNISINGNCDNNTANKLKSTFEVDVCNHILTELNKIK